MSNQNTVTPEQVEKIMEQSEIEVVTLYDKCTIVTCKLPSGFIIVESSACVDPANYSEEMGKKICLDRITNKIWELEGYVLQSQIGEIKE